MQGCSARRCSLLKIRLVASPQLAHPASDQHMQAHCCYCLSLLLHTAAADVRDACKSAAVRASHNPPCKETPWHPKVGYCCSPWGASIEIASSLGSTVMQQRNMPVACSPPDDAARLPAATQAA